MKVIGKMFSRGRVTIPKIIREKLNLFGGAKLALNVKDQRLILKLVKKT